MPQTNRVFAWVRDRHDPRDHRFGVSAGAAPFAPVQLPESVDLSPRFPPAYDQADLGSCVYNAMAGLYAYLLEKEGKPSYTPSRLFGYWNGRQIEGTVDQDAGSSIRTGMQVLANFGAPPEALWPYDTSKFRQQPPRPAYDAAAPHKATAYQRLDQTLSHMQTCLSMGFPFAFGIDCYPAIQSAAVAKTGVVPMPQGRPIGGHALLCVGYSMKQRLFKFRNSWSPRWGMTGYGFLPFDYMLGQHAVDFWTAQVAS